MRRNQKQNKKQNNQRRRKFNLPLETRPVRSNLPMGRPKRTRTRQPKTWLGIYDQYAPTLGGVASNLVRDVISKFGDYKVAKNTLMSGSSIPKVSNGGRSGAVRLSHCEYLGDLLSTTAFTLTNFPLNPGLSQTFPWLSTLASSFEEYVFHGVIFELKSTSSNAVLSSGASTALGTMIVATQYDPLDDDFINKSQMLNYEFASSSDPSKNLIHPIECAYKQTTIPHRYIRNGPAPANSDIRLYDWGKTQMATSGMQNIGGAIAEIWISYDIELYKPKLPLPGSVSSEIGVAQYSFTPTNATPFAVPVQIFDDLGLSFTDTTIRFPPSKSTGVFLYYYYVTGSSTAMTTPTVVLTNASFLNLFQGGTVAGITTTGTAVLFNTYGCVDISAPGAIISFGALGVYPASPTHCELVVTEIPVNAKILAEIRNTKYLQTVFETNESDSDSESEFDDAVYEKLRTFLKRMHVEGDKKNSPRV